MGPTPSLDEDVRFAVDVARQAGLLTLEWFQRVDLRVDHKSDGTVVTDADHEAERLIRRRLEERFPADSIVGEEGADRIGSSGRTWFIDPIDGTKAFTQGVPLYATLLAMIDDQGPAVGVIHLPGLDETVSAGRGLGAHHNGAPCHVSSQTSLAGSYVCTSGLSYWTRQQLERALNAGINLRTWGDAYGYALVATGRSEAMIDPECNDWDVAPMAVIIPESGGVFTDATGNRSGPFSSGVASNGHHHTDYLTWLAD